MIATQTALNNKANIDNPTTESGVILFINHTQKGSVTVHITDNIALNITCKNATCFFRYHHLIQPSAGVDVVPKKHHNNSIIHIR